ncbi:1-phosphatidylinositol-3-phosphate 5-kinase FAB1B isoform X1 [Dendrobium catenatum]|uniref:1-phosphatidylinositol-3-phosphate 5-kinase n=2 Tax=Dendrobium catenatum TaxID=906689 RepID=A0A2I0XHJ0_9ASPA|nr:1-phosphatidylinositol-3-phosphate 5-kinase FAB1B isoform X1 [Dendrobium catenatum]PKU87387.1 1-phosphatidylinositol-3-phosphate 5-kinase FAB1B [Dendrobium catenatum]
MGTRENMFSGLLELVKSWFPRRTEPAYVSRNFWMPDNSCRVCYDCDVQFTAFVRKHHCRLCGRVFCGKCTSNSIPVPSVDPNDKQLDGDRVRVCNFCFQQWRQEVPPAANVILTSNARMDDSSLTDSMVTTRSSCTFKSSTMTACSMSYSKETYQRVSYGSPSSSVQSGIMELDTNKQDALMLGRNMSSAAYIGNTFSNNFGYCKNSVKCRSEDDDDDAYGLCYSDSAAHRFQHSDDYYGSVDFDETDQDYDTNNVLLAEENIPSEDASSPVADCTNLLDFTYSDEMAEAGPEHRDAYGVSSSIYAMEGADEPVDFENNELLWLPTEPEVEEDESEAISNGEDHDATGEWGSLRMSKSFGSGSTDEHRGAMKNVVGGHFRALIAQLLQVENLPIGDEGDKESWLEIITSLSWEAATLLKPDTSNGGGMDPSGYVKVKCIACGHRSQSVVVRGVVCKKNVAHRHMKSNIEKPNILILGGALEYQRVMNYLSSFDTLLQQEMDHLKMAIARIDSNNPHLLLVEKSVSRFAQDFLLAKDISLVLNIKRPLLERISRCTGAQIVPSIDHVSSPRLGRCDLFHVEKFFEEHGSAGQEGKKVVKTLMFFEECPRPLGCTILLKGANGDELKRVKHVVQYGIFAAYHLALETSYLADEGASLPELSLKPPITVALQDKPSGVNRSISTVPGFASDISFATVPSDGVNSNIVQDTYSETTMPEEVNLHASPLQSSSLSSQTVDAASTLSTQPENSEKLDTWNFSYAMHAVEPQSRVSLTMKDCISTFSNNVSGQFPREKNKTCFLESSIAETISNDVQEHTISKPVALEDDLNQEDEVGLSHALNFYQGQVQESTQMLEDFSPCPSDHQSILVSLSSRCVWKGTVCERSHLFRIKYYGSFDKPLGRFLRDHLFDQSYQCPSCDMPSEAHIYCYTHQQGSLTISVRKLTEFRLSGERDGKIWMWHRCLRCPRLNGFPPATRRIVMSDAAWGLSFGKFLELSFSNHAAASRVASCGHSLHRDCLRFYGFGKKVACFRYASINVHSVYLPPHKLHFNHRYQDWVQKEANEVDERKELLFANVLSSLRRIAAKRPCCEVKTENPKFNHFIHKLEEMQLQEKEEFEESLNKVLKKELNKGEPFIDILEINKLKRQLIFQSYIWDQRLIFATGLEHHPHEFLSGFLISDSEKSPTDKLEDPNLTTKVQGTNTADLDFRIDDITKDGKLAVSLIDKPSDQPNSWNLYQQKFTTEADTVEWKQKMTSLSTCASEGAQLDPLASGLSGHITLSDGQFPILANISDTFDAKWTGEYGPAFTDLSTLDSSASVDPATLVAHETEKKGVADVTESLASALCFKLGDSTEEFSNWVELPFLDLYHSFNMGLGFTPRFVTLNEYNPVHVSLFQEFEHQGGGRLLLPIGENETVIPVYDDEPTSLISYALVSPNYCFQMSDDRERTRDLVDSSFQSTLSGPVNLQFSHSMDELSSESFRSFGSTEESTLSLTGSRSSLDPVLYTKTMHARISFEDDGPLGKVKYTVICYYAKHFDALRRTCCPSELDFIRSLSRCKKWGAPGGKSNAFFAKSLDDRFIIKQVTKTEIESFIKFAPEYFKYLSESIDTGSPTCLAKILGIYQVATKHLRGGKEMKMDVLVMENLLFGRTVKWLYDLKGSLRSRYNPDANGNNKVLLDQNLIEAIPTSPIFVGNKAKRLLERAVWNDTSLLASIDVMDYSLLVGVDEMKHELVIGIIDFMRQYTWDKHLETWVKAAGILGGPKNVSPTVISPKQYKKRFRKAMSAYFLVVPNQWSPLSIIPSKLHSDQDQDSRQND